MADGLGIVPPSGGSLEAAPALVLAAVLGVVLLTISTAVVLDRIRSRLARVSRALAAPPARAPDRSPAPPEAPLPSTAILLVDGYDAPGIHALLEVAGRFPGAFGRIFLLAARPFDMTDREREEESRRLQAGLEASLERYRPLAALLDMEAVPRAVLGPDPEEAMALACEAIAGGGRRPVLFWTRAEITPARWYHRFLPIHAQRRAAGGLFRRGWTTVELPLSVRVRTAA